VIFVGFKIQLLVAVTFCKLKHYRKHDNDDTICAARTDKVRAILAIDQLINC